MRFMIFCVLLGFAGPVTAQQSVPSSLTSIRLDQVRQTFDEFRSLESAAEWPAHEANSKLRWGLFQAVAGAGLLAWAGPTSWEYDEAEWYHHAGATAGLFSVWVSWSNISGAIEYAGEVSSLTSRQRALIAIGPGPRLGDGLQMAVVLRF